MAAFSFCGVVPRWDGVYRVKSHERPTRVKEVVARFGMLVVVFFSNSVCTGAKITDATGLSGKMSTY